jgi:Anti-sigma-K factor rskA
VKYVVNMADDHTIEPSELDVRVDATLASAATWVQPPPDLRARVLAAATAGATPAPIETSIETPLGAKRMAPPVTPVTPVVEGEAAAVVVDMVSRRRGPHWIIAAVAGAAAALIGAVGFTQLRHQTPQVDATATLVAAAAQPGAAGAVNMRETKSGWEFRLNTTNLPLLEKPQFYEAWIEGDKGLIPIGTFHTGVDVVLWGGVELDEYPKIVITREQEDGNPAASNDRVLTGNISFRKK